VSQHGSTAGWLRDLFVGSSDNVRNFLRDSSFNRSLYFSLYAAL
jgi:hypothetical protein